MKNFLLITVFVSSAVLAQNSKTAMSVPNDKPSTTSCPTWSKKGKKSSKADYFQFLQSGKPLPNTVETKNLNHTKETTQTHNAKKNITAEERPGNINKINTSSNTKNSFAGKKSNEKFSKPEAESSSTNLSVPKQSEQTTSKEEHPPSSANQTKDKKELSQLEKKIARLSRKTTKVRKHSNSKCPSF